MGSLDPILAAFETERAITVLVLRMYESGTHESS